MFSNQQRKVSRVSMAVMGGLFVEVINKLIPVFILAYAQSRIGIQGFGTAQFVITLVEMALPFITFGYSYYAAFSFKDAEKKLEDLRELVSGVLTLRLFHALIVSLILSSYAYFQQSSNYPTQMLPFVLPILFLAAFDMTFVNFGAQRMLRLSVVVGICKILSLVTIVFLVVDSDDLWVYTLATLGVGGAVNLYTSFWVIPKVGLKSPSLHQLKAIFRKSIPFAGIVLLVPAFERFDVLIVETMVHGSDLGRYMGAWRLAFSFLPFLMIVINAFLSEVFVRQDTEQFLKHISSAFLISLCLMAPIFIGSIFVGEDLLVLVYDENYVSASVFFSIFCFSILIESLLLIFGVQVMVFYNQTKKLIWVLATFVFAGALICYFVGLFHNPLWVAVSAVAVRLSCGLWCFMESRKFVGQFVRIDRKFIGLGGALVAMSAILFLLQDTNLVFKIVVSGSAYLLSFIYLCKNDLKRIFGMI